MVEQKTKVDLPINQIICGDCLEVMKTFPDESIDLIIVDPPYFLPAEHYQTRKQFRRNFADLGILEHFFKDFFQEILRILKKDKHLYVFCDGQSYPLFYYYLYGDVKSARPLIWDKKTSINAYTWRHQHELIIFAEMPNAVPIPSGDGDILRFSAVNVDVRKHPAEKPVALLRKLILKSSKKGDIILDPMCGSGSALEASLSVDRKFIGIDISSEYCDIARKRVAIVPNKLAKFMEVGV
jgi:site-specific DNA-methyltransferase (adenine-specific)